MGHAIRAAPGMEWETWGVWPGCVTGRPSGMTSHQSLTTIWSSKQNTPTSLVSSCTQPPPNPRIDGVSTAIDRSYVSGHWHYSCMTSTIQATALLMLYMSSNIDLHTIFCSHKREAWGEEWKRIREGWLSRHAQTPPKKDGEKFDGFLISVWNQTASERGECSVEPPPPSCQKSGSNLQSKDKTSFSLRLNHW